MQPAAWISALFLFAASGCGRPTLIEGNTAWDVGAHSSHPRGIVVPKQQALEISPGTVIELGAGSRIDIQGSLRAAGTAEQPVRFEAGGGTWKGFTVRGGHLELRHAVINGVKADWTIRLADGAEARLEHLTLEDIQAGLLLSETSSFLLADSMIPPLGENEVIRGHGIPPEGFVRIMGNTFHPNFGYKDIIDFADCTGPGPIPEVVGNTFLGAGDDGADFDRCDAVITSNLFLGFKARGHEKHAHAISLGAGSRVSGTDNIVARSACALGIKRGSILSLTNTLFYENEVIAYAAEGRGDLPHGTIVLERSIVCGETRPGLDTFSLSRLQLDSSGENSCTPPPRLAEALQQTP